MIRLAVIGAGLAGCEAVNLLLKNGYAVDLFEMKPASYTEAHKIPGWAELVCSNSLKTCNPLHPSGMLKNELEQLGSIIMWAAQQTRVPAGEALAVDRGEFSRRVTDRLASSGALTVHTGEVASLPPHYDYYVIATGPLTSPAFSAHIASLVGSSFLYFYDAIAPIIDADSIDRSKVFAGSRYGKGGDDYLNIPLTEAEYEHFVEELRTAAKVVLRPFEKEIYYEGCMPIEVLADRGRETLAYGPMKPVGFDESLPGTRPYAVIQLRREDRDGNSFNMVGFQTKLTPAEQERIFRTLPGLEHAEFLRLGSIHRNTYIHSPAVLQPTFNMKSRDTIYFGGQITGSEGYVESAATGLLAALALVFRLKGDVPLLPGPRTALGALLSHLHRTDRNFQPSGIHAGLFECGVRKRRKADKRQFLLEQEQTAFSAWLSAARAVVTF